jgi:hypothetical protein
MDTIFNGIDGILSIAFYMLPTIIAWYRQKQGKSIVIPFGLLFCLNFFVGWTIVGWFLALANALGFNPVAAIVPSLVKHLPASGPGPGVPQAGSAGGGAVPCGQCGGTGSTTCSSCGGRGNWFEAPTGATGSGEQRSCSACIGSGRLRCVTCGGTGRAQTLLG